MINQEKITMNIRFVQGDVFLTRMQSVAVGLNTTGRVEVTPFFTTIQDRYPVFVSEYRKRGRAERLTPGDFWVWREGQPWLVGLVIRDTPQGPARLRYIETALLNLYKNWEREGLHSLALALTVDEIERPALHDLVARYLGTLPVVVYEAHLPSVDAEVPPKDD
jgi:hypothetical protein